ncbi:unnamed protein product [Leuciscus chuanchicus]
MEMLLSQGIGALPALSECDVSPSLPLSLALSPREGRHKGRNGGRGSSGVVEKLHEASIKDNHLQRSRSSSEHRKERADTHRIQPAVTAAHLHYNRFEFFTDKASLPP